VRNDAALEIQDEDGSSAAEPETAASSAANATGRTRGSDDPAARVIAAALSAEFHAEIAVRDPAGIVRSGNVRKIPEACQMSVRSSSLNGNGFHASGALTCYAEFQPAVPGEVLQLRCANEYGGINPDCASNAMFTMPA